MFFGVVPPDLSLAARSRGPDWLYTYLRGFYRDPATKTGWNNTVFPNVGMPHVLWEYQGDQVLQVTDAHGPEHRRQEGDAQARARAARASSSRSSTTSTSPTS